MGLTAESKSTVKISRCFFHLVFSARTYIEIIIRTQHGDDYAKRNEHFVLYESDKYISFVSRGGSLVAMFWGGLCAQIAHRKRYKLERRCADYKRHKKGGKNFKNSVDK